MTPTQKYRKSSKGIAAKKRYNEGKGIATNRNYAWKRHGIDMDYSRYLKMVEECQDSCVLCSEKQNTHRRKLSGIQRTLSVDHCHETGKVRGLLCNDHNRHLELYQGCIPALLNYLEIPPKTS